jgi:xylan 1,4-beta-xylosidase
VNDVSQVTSVLQRARNASGDLPILITEFGSSYVPGHANATTGSCHDTYEAASFLARVFDETTAPGARFDLEVLSYWAISDVFDEAPFPAVNASFYGNFGLVNTFGVPKPGYRVLQLMNMMGHERIESVAIHSDDPICSATLGGFAARNGTHVLLLVYNQAPRGVAIHECSVEVAVRAQTTSTAKAGAVIFRIDDEHANPKRAWEELGAPQWPSASQNEQILKASELRAEAAAVSSIGALSLGILPAQGVVAAAIPIAATAASTN